MGGFIFGRVTDVPLFVDVKCTLILGWLLRATVTIVGLDSWHERVFERWRALLIDFTVLKLRKKSKEEIYTIHQQILTGRFLSEILITVGFLTIDAIVWQVYVLCQNRTRLIVKWLILRIKHKDKRNSCKTGKEKKWWRQSI